MSERQPSHENAEHLKPIETSTEHLRKHHEREAASSERKHHNENHIENIHKKIEQHAISGKEHSVVEHKQAQPHPVLVNKQLKDMAYHRALTRTRKRLSPVSKTFSKVVHSSVIDKPSEFIGKTVARPQGMLWGAVFSFIGTSALLWITRHYGYEYNYLLAILLFVIGAVIGTALEGVLYLLKKPR